MLDDISMGLLAGTACSSGFCGAAQWRQRDGSPPAHERTGDDAAEAAVGDEDPRHAAEAGEIQQRRARTRIQVHPMTTTNGMQRRERRWWFRSASARDERLEK